MVETLISEQKFVSRVDLTCMSYYASLIAMHKKTVYGDAIAKCGSTETIQPQTIN